MEKCVNGSKLKDEMKWAFQILDCCTTVTNRSIEQIQPRIYETVTFEIWRRKTMREWRYLNG